MTKQTGKQSFWSSCFEAVFFGGIFLALGGGLSYWGWTIVQNAQASSSWPTVEGTVTNSEVARVSDADGGVTYSPEITYEYVVDDVQFEGSTIKFGENTYSSKRKADGIVANYPANKTVIIYYDPQDPARSVLEPGVSGGSFIVLGLGILFGLIGLVTAPLVLISRTRGENKGK